MALLNKYDLACYIIDKYRKEYRKEISPIKLQKSLYFLFAMWGEKIADAKREGNEDTEDDETYSKYDKYLFDASFEAWRYGPVDREIYDKFKSGDLKCSNTYDSMFNSPDLEFVKAYIDDILTKIFNTNDFSLVDLTHEDRCWKDAISIGIKSRILNKTIIRDYQRI